MIRIDRSKGSFQLLCLTSANALFFITYSFLLTGGIAMWNLVFLILYILFYFTLRLTLRGRLWSVLRVLGSTTLILVSLVNFAHYRIFNEFITASSGFGRMPNLSEIGLLSGYWSSVPFRLYVLALVLFVYVLYLEFFWNPSGKRSSIVTQRPMVSIGVMLLATVAACVMPSFIPSSSWYASGKYYGDLGPIGYLGVEASNAIARSVLHSGTTEDPVRQAVGKTANPNGAIMDLLAKLSVSSQIRAITLPTVKAPKNIVVYQLESVPAWAVQLDDGPMPFLQQLMKEGITVDHFYGNDCHTIGAEFTAACSLLTSSAEVIGNRLEPLQYSCLPKKLSSMGYDTSVYHANVPTFWNRDTLLPQVGYEHLYFSPFFTPRAYDGTVASILVSKMEDTAGPNMSYLIGFTSHGPHTQHYIERNLKESGIVITPLSGPLPEVTKRMQVSETELRNYFGFLRSVDDSIRGFFETLKANDDIDDTIVVLYGDHRYYSFGDESARDYQLYNELPFVMVIPGMAPERIPITASHIDIAPTLAHLLGMSGIDTASFMGQSIFSPSRYNYAFGKCGDEVYYFTGDTVVRGNQKVGRYKAQSMSTNADVDFDPAKIRMIRDVAVLSDQIWSYDPTVTLPDGTLVKGSGVDVYLIEAGRKRLIENEETFAALGDSWLDIHEIPDEVLKNYPIGTPIRDAESGMQRVVGEAGSGGSILRPSTSYNFKKYIAHALGSAGSVTGCNCKEAFDESYVKGFRIFELDLALTADDRIVLFNEGNESNIGSTKSIGEMTEKVFLSSKYDERLTLLNLDDLFKLMKEKPDMYIVLDTNEDFETIMRQFVAIAKRTSPDILARVIPQIYIPEQLATILSLYHFTDIIYTLPRTEPSHESVISFLMPQDNITAITTRDTKYNEAFKNELAKMDISLFVQTVNDRAAIQSFIDRGVGVYTDSLK